VGLVAAIDLKVERAELVNLPRPNPSTFFGEGAVKTVGQMVEDLGPEAGTAVVVVNHALSPVQQRNLERAWKAKVVDRTGIILEIFGARARTREGMLQVELAALTYQRSRLVRSWTHLERQRGGFGFLGGPGESQLELDRRLILDRIDRIKKELEDVRRTRGLHRRARERVPYPVIALVGYTNAGKSTLFNRLAGADVFAKDLLFATLDPTMRAVTLPSGRKVILSDTVGFISDLPTQLVAAFRATLEEVQAADLIVHVRDVSHPDSEAQKADVEQVLAGLDIEVESDTRVIETLNKLDALDEAGRAEALARAARAPDRVVALSALSGEGIDRLAALFDAHMTADRVIVDLDVGIADGAALAWLYRHGEILERRDDDEVAHLKLSIGPAERARFAHRFPAYAETAHPETRA
jgi:GTP-binding protein HflX